MRNLLIVLLLTGSQALAQQPGYMSDSREKLKTGIGVAFTGTDAMWGYSMNTAYHYYLNQNISIAPGLSVMHFRDDQENVLRTAQAEAIDLGVYFHLMAREQLSFELGAGGNLRYFHWGIATTLAESYTFDDQLIRAGSKATFDHFTGGYFLSAGFGYRINPKLRLLFAEVLQNDPKGNVTWDSRISLLIQL
jgi:hypothetical protein